MYCISSVLLKMSKVLGFSKPGARQQRWMHIAARRKSTAVFRPHGTTGRDRKSSFNINIRLQHQHQIYFEIRLSFLQLLQLRGLQSPVGHLTLVSNTIRLLHNIMLSYHSKNDLISSKSATGATALQRSAECMCPAGKPRCTRKRSCCSCYSIYSTNFDACHDLSCVY